MTAAAVLVAAVTGNGGIIEYDLDALEERGLRHHVHGAQRVEDVTVLPSLAQVSDIADAEQACRQPERVTVLHEGVEEVSRVVPILAKLPTHGFSAAKNYDVRYEKAKIPIPRIIDASRTPELGLPPRCLDGPGYVLEVRHITRYPSGLES